MAADFDDAFASDDDVKPVTKAVISKKEVLSAEPKIAPEEAA